MGKKISSVASQLKIKRVKLPAEVITFQVVPSLTTVCRTQSATLSGRVFLHAASEITPEERNVKLAWAKDKRWMPEQICTLQRAHRHLSRVSCTLSRQKSPPKKVQIWWFFLFVLFCFISLQFVQDICRICICRTHIAQPRHSHCCLHTKGAKGHHLQGCAYSYIYSAVKQ